MKATKDNMGIIIILYNPTEQDVENVFTVAQNYKGAVVDNSSERHFATEKVGRMTYIPLLVNAGIAEAQNVGIRCLRKDHNIGYIVFFDQDSRFPMEYPEEMRKEYCKIKNAGIHLGLLGPTVVEKDNGEEYKSAIHKDHLLNDSLVVRRDVISSGSIVEVHTLSDVGLMLSTMFIDFVDFEWCWRAECKGYICGITPNIQLHHKVGNNNITFGRYKVQVWSPFRYYYQYRNYLWLATLPYVPLQWKVATGVKHIMRILYFPFFVKEGIKCMKQMLKGVCAAIKARDFLNEARSYGKR